MSESPATAVPSSGAPVSGEQRYRVRFPRTVDAEQATALWRSVAGLLPRWWRRWWQMPTVTFEVSATAAGITHDLTVSGGSAQYLLAALRAAIPGVCAVPVPGRPMVTVGLARELRVIGPGMLRRDVAPASTAGLLAALQPLRPSEQIVLQYVVQPAGPHLADLVARLVGGEQSEKPPRDWEPELRVAIRVGARAAAPARRGQLLARVLAALHATSSPEARLRRAWLPSAIVAARLRDATPPGMQRLAADELASVVPIPLAGPALPGLALVGARTLPPDARIPGQGFILGDALGTDEPRPTALPVSQITRGLYLCQPTGGGKTTVLLHLALQVLERGQTLFVVESKGDLVAALADRIDPSREVIVFDPADRTAPVGFNLIGGSEDAALVADGMVSQLRARYGAAGLGPRSEDILRAALLTLASEPGRYTLCEVEPLLTNPGFRERLLGRLDEPVLEGFWAWFTSLSAAARAEAIAPLANKLRTFTLRRRVRAVIGQTTGLDLAAALAERRIVLCSLAKGLVGEDAAALIGAAIAARLWAAVMGRAAIPERERHPAVVICDEFADFAAHLPFGEVVAQSRGYGVGWVLAHQNLAQLTAETRAAVLANLRSRVIGQTSAQDAAAFARELAPHLAATDLMALGPFECYAQLSVGAAVAPPVSLRTRPAPEARGSEAAVRARSRARYGRAPSDVDAAIRRRVAGDRARAPIGGRRRP